LTGLNPCEQFLNWVDKKGLIYWHQLRFEHVSKYQKSLSNRGLSYDTVRLYLWPIRRAARWVASNWPHHYPNICANLRLTKFKSGSHEYCGDRGNPVMSIHEVLYFLDWLTQHDTWDRLAPCIVLQGLCGLRLQEALRLMWKNVDFESQTVTVQGEVKNEFSVRCIPVPMRALWILRRARQAGKGIQPHTLITPFYSDYRHYSHAVRKALRSWNPNGRIKPKDFRNSIVSVALKDGWYDIYLQRYVGHAPKTIGERHYHGDQGSRLIPLY